MTTGPPIPEERCRIHPAGGLGVPPKSLSAPPKKGGTGGLKKLCSGESAMLVLS